MDTKRTFRLVVVANNLTWQSLRAKMDAVRAFYAPVCNLEISIVSTRLQPVFAPFAALYTVDQTWYDNNVAIPHALDADIVMFVTPQTDHPGLPTYQGIMTFNNFGPWETTIFAGGENDNLYMQGKNFGDSFTHFAIHELSHAFYYYCGKRDDTHVHFPTGQVPYIDSPKNVLADFNFNSQYAIFEQLKDSLLAALAALSIIKKRQMASVRDPFVSVG